jgi:hypothetical protein
MENASVCGRITSRVHPQRKPWQKYDRIGAFVFMDYDFILYIVAGGCNDIKSAVGMWKNI